MALRELARWKRGRRGLGWAGLGWAGLRLYDVSGFVGWFGWFVRSFFWGGGDGLVGG